MGSLGPLPPIGASHEAPPVMPTRSAEEQAALEVELDAMHELLGVKRGKALKEAMKPQLVVPSMPTPDFAVPTELSDEQAMLKLAAAANAERREGAA